MSLTGTPLLLPVLLTGTYTVLSHSAGADEYLPLLIYAILQAAPPNLHSNVQYIMRYDTSIRRPVFASVCDFLPHSASDTKNVDSAPQKNSREKAATT